MRSIQDQYHRPAAGGAGDGGSGDTPPTAEGADDYGGFDHMDEAYGLVLKTHTKKARLDSSYPAVREGIDPISPLELETYNEAVEYLKARFKDGRVSINPNSSFFTLPLVNKERDEIIKTFKKHNEIMTDLEPIGDEFLTIPEEAPPAEDDAPVEEAPAAFKAAYTDQPLRPDEETFEVSTRGNDLGKQFSALNATLPNGSTIEDVYQNVIKRGVGKGRLPEGMSKEDLHKAYTDLWREWADGNPEKLAELAEATRGKTLVDRFAYSTGTGVSQAHSLAEILNERHGTSPEAPPEPADERGEPEDSYIQMADLDKVLSNHHENTQHRHVRFGPTSAFTLPTTGTKIKLSDMAYGPGGKRMMQLSVPTGETIGVYFSKSGAPRAEGTDGKWMPLKGFSAEGKQGTKENDPLLPHAT